MKIKNWKDDDVNSGREFSTRIDACFARGISSSFKRGTGGIGDLLNDELEVAFQGQERGAEREALEYSPVGSGASRIEKRGVFATRTVT